MKIHLPNSAFLGNIEFFLRSLDLSERDSLYLSSNKQWVSMHPVVLAIVASLGLLCQPENIHAEPFEAKSAHYIKRMGLFDLLKIKSDIKITEHEPSGRFIPLTQISQNQELTHFITDMIPLLHLEAHRAEPIRYIVSELVRNVFEHAQSKNGAIVCAQYHKKSNMIRIGIVDNGIGIKQSIGTYHKVENDAQAIRMALTPGITGTTSRIGGTEFNAGAGLFFIKSIAKANRNFFVLYSGNALYKLLKSQGEKRTILYDDPWRDHHSLSEDLPLWNGTVVGIDTALEPTQNFSSLLEELKTTFTKALRQRKEEMYKKAKFI